MGKISWLAKQLLVSRRC